MKLILFEMYFWSWKTKTFAIYNIITEILTIIGELPYSVIGCPFTNFHFPKWLVIERLIMYMSLHLLFLLWIIIFFRITKINDDGKFELNVPTNYDDISYETLAAWTELLILNPYRLMYLILNGCVCSVMYISDYFKLNEITSDTKMLGWIFTGFYTLALVIALICWIEAALCENRDNEDTDETILI